MVKEVGVEVGGSTIPLQKSVVNVMDVTGVMDRTGETGETDMTGETDVTDVTGKTDMVYITSMTDGTLLVADVGLWAGAVVEHRMTGPCGLAGDS